MNAARYGATESRPAGWLDSCDLPISFDASNRVSAPLRAALSNIVQSCAPGHGSVLASQPPASSLAALTGASLRRA